MHDPTPALAARIDDIQAVYRLVKETPAPGLPMPFTGPDRAAFWFITITRAEDARDAVAQAKAVFADRLGAVFGWKDVWTENGTRRQYEALLTSGLSIVLTAKAEHMQDEDAEAGELELVAVA